MRTKLLLLSAVALMIGLPLKSAERNARMEARVFLPKPLSDDWNKWFAGEWETSRETDTGSGKGTVRIELGLNGQFRIHAGQVVVQFEI